FTGEVLPEGEKGELVFTSLTKEAMPVIRYRTRDLTRLLPGTARPGMRRMEKVTGRTDDMIILRGVNLFPTQIEEIVLRTPGHSVDTLRDAAVRLFNERGYEATSVDEVATRLGVTKSAIYHHVPSKGELLRLALDRALDALFAVTQETGATTGPAIERLEYVV